MIYNFVDEEMIGRKVRLLYNLSQNKRIKPLVLRKYLKNNMTLKLRSFTKIILNEYMKNNPPRDKRFKESKEKYSKYLKNYERDMNYYARLYLDDLIINYTSIIIADWDKRLKTMINGCIKNMECHKPKKVYISKNEIKVIKSVESFNNYGAIELRKLLYVILIMGKSHTNKKGDHWVNLDTDTLFKMARFKYRTKYKSRLEQREEVIREFANKGLIELSNKSGFKVIYYEKDIVQEDRVLELSLVDGYDNIDNIVLKYLNYYKEELNEGRYYYCMDCGIEIKKKGRGVKSDYCAKCIKNRKKEYDRVYQQNKKS